MRNEHIILLNCWYVSEHKKPCWIWIDSCCNTHVIGFNIEDQIIKCILNDCQVLVRVLSLPLFLRISVWQERTVDKSQNVNSIEIYLHIQSEIIKRGSIDLWVLHISIFTSESRVYYVSLTWICCVNCSVRVGYDINIVLIKLNVSQLIWVLYITD